MGGSLTGRGDVAPGRRGVTKGPWLLCKGVRVDDTSRTMRQHPIARASKEDAFAPDSPGRALG